MARNDILDRKRAYARIFCDAAGKIGPEGERVLADLRRFCHIDDAGIVVSPVQIQTDPYATMYRVGMRDVYLHIVGLLTFDESRVLKGTEYATDENSIARSEPK